MTACRQEAEAAAAMAAAAAAQAEAEVAWQDQLALRFDPDLGASLARHLLERTTAVEAARARLDAATRASAAAALRWRGEDARCAAVDREHRRLRARIAARAEERRLAALADRLAFRWRPR